MSVLNEKQKEEFIKLFCDYELKPDTDIPYATPRAILEWLEKQDINGHPVWIVETYIPVFDSYEIRGVFSTIEKSKEFIKENNMDATPGKFIIK